MINYRLEDLRDISLLTMAASKALVRNTGNTAWEVRPPALTDQANAFSSVQTMPAISMTVGSVPGIDILSTNGGSNFALQVRPWFNSGALVAYVTMTGQAYFADNSSCDGVFTINGGLTFSDTKNVIFSTVTGTKFAANSGTAVNDASTFTGAVGATAYRISDIVKALKNLGFLAQ